MKKERPPNRPKCPRCATRFVYYRVETDSYLCRTCGKAFRWNAGSNKMSDYKILKVE